MITGITITGLKGTDDRVVDMGQLTLITGPVGSGKTAVLDAIRFAALGFIPGLGKGSSDTAAVMSGNQLGVAVRLERHTFDRQLTKRKSTLRATAMCSWLADDDEITDAKRGEAITKAFGTDINAAGENLDIRELLTATGTDRAKRLKQLVDATGVDRERQQTLVVAIAQIRAAGQPIPSDLEKAEQAAIGAAAHITFDPEILAAAKTQVLEAETYDAFISWASKRKKEASAIQKELVAAHAVLESELAGHKGAGDNAEELEAQLAQLDRDIAKHTQLVESAEKAAQAKAEVEKAIPALTTIRDAAEAKLAEAAGPLDRVAVLRREAGDLAKGGEPYPAEPTAPTRKLSEHEPPLTKLREKLDGVGQALLWNGNQELVEARENRASTAVKLEGVESALSEGPWFMVHQVITDMAIVDVPNTPVHEDHKQWIARLREATIRAVGDPEEERTKLVAAEQEVRNWEAARADWIRTGKDLLSLQIAEAEKLLAEVQAEWDAHELALTQWRPLRDSWQESTKQATADIQAKNEEANAIESDHQDAKDAATKAASDLKEMEARAEGVDSALATTAEAERTARTEVEAQHKTLKPRAKAAGVAEGIRQQKKISAQKVDEADLTAKFHGAIHWAAQRVQEQMIASGSLVTENVSKFLKAAGLTKEAYLVSPKAGVLELGWRGEDGVNIACDALSGGEGVVFSAGMAAAAISIRNPDLKLLLVEAAELGLPETSQQILLGCEHAAKEWGVQCVVVSCIPMEPSDEWKVIDLAPTAVEA